jgi:hypothetical protein
MEQIIPPLGHLQIQLEQKYIERPIYEKYSMLLAGDTYYNLNNFYSIYYVGSLWVGNNKKQIPLIWDTGS